jgi:serine/threonine protein kinase
MHCDLKPNNILMDLVQTSKIKIIPVIGDFGMAQIIKPEESNTTCKQKPMIQALPYQAPEVLCSNIAFAENEPKRQLVESSEMSKSKKKRMKLRAPGTIICKSGVYDEAVDIWSMGVIIIRILLDGRTPSDEMDTSRAPQHFEKYQAVVESRESFMKWAMSDKDSWKDTMDWMSGQEDQAILSQLLEVARQCLTINPIKRPSAERILKMPPFSPPIPVPKDGTLVVDDDLYFANYRRHILSKFGCHSSTHEIANRIRQEFETSENKPVTKSRSTELAYMAACCILAIKFNEPKLIISGRERYTSYNEAIAPFVLVSGSVQELLDAEIAVVAAIGFKIPFLKQEYQIRNNDLNDNL